MPSNVARPNSNRHKLKKPSDRGGREKFALNNTGLWTALAVLSGLGLIAFVLLLRLLLPLLLLLGFFALCYWLWRIAHRYHQRRRRRQARLSAQFYQLLKRQQGRISALDFAMFARIEGSDAQNYLNEQAQAFSAYCEATVQGDIIYVFDLTAVSRPTQYEAAQVAWAWTEQARARQAYIARQMERQRAAWISAQQMRALQERLSLRNASPSPQELLDNPVIPLPAPPDEYRELSVEERLQIQTGQGRCSPDVALRYSPPSSQSIEAQSSECRSAQSDDEVVTIEVKAVRS